MKTAALLTLIFSFQGYWFGGQDAHLQITPTVQMPATKATLSWTLSVNDVAVGNGQVPFELSDKPADVVIHTPTVTRRTDLKFAYSILLTDQHKVLQKGETPVHLFPTDLLADHSKADAGKTIVVLDSTDDVVKALERAKLKPIHVKRDSRLALNAPDLVVIGPTALTKEANETVTDLIENGASALVLWQPAGGSVMGYTYAQQKAPPKFCCELAHPLFRGLDADDLESLARNDSRMPVCIQLPADSPALVLGSWPHELPLKDGDRVAPTSALFVTATIGKGRLLACQISALDWDRDPRAAILLNNALDYLNSPPEPTRRPSERVKTPEPNPPVPSENRIPLGE